MALGDLDFSCHFMVDLELSVVPSGLGGSFVDLLSWSWGVLPVGNVGYRLAVGFVTLAQPLPCEGASVCLKDS